MKIVASNSLTLSNVNDGTDAPTITVKSYTYSAGYGAKIELTGPNAFKQTVYNRGHNVWVIDATTHELKEFVSCDTYTTMSFSHNGVSTTLADYLASLKDSIIVIAASDADSVDQNVRDVLNSMGGFPDLGTWDNWRYGHAFIGMSKRNDGTWPLQPRQGYEEYTNKDGSAPEIGCTLSKGGIVANGAAGKTQYTHIAYANSSDGVTNFSTSDSNRTYIGMYVDFNINDSNTPSDYSWTLVKGADGTQGTPGKPGADGKTPYFHTAWSYSADGTDRFSTVYPNLNLLVKTNQGVVNWRWALSGGDTSVEEVNVDGIRAVKLIKSTTTTSTSWNYISYDGLLRKLIQPSTKYVLSFDVKPSVDVSFIATLMRGDGLGQLTDDTAMNKASANQWTKVSCVLTSRETFPDDLYQKVYLRGMSIANGNWLIIKNIKLEPGSTATPYMPSANEVTTADYPSYIGQYTDFTQADSTKSSDYTWSLIRGNDGKDGADGHDGRAGKDGNGIKTTVITYAISTSGTTAPTTGWTSSVPSLVKGQYLWTKTVWTYTDNSSETGYSVSYISKDGNNGHDGIAGKDGVGIKTTTITYAVGASGTTAPESGWNSQVPNVPAGKYLWTKTVWTYTDNTSETGYSVARMGLKGDKGDPGAPGIKGSDGIIVSSVAPASPHTGQLWQDTSTTPQLVKKWTGESWVIWELYAQNLKADTLETISAKIGKIYNEFEYEATGNLNKGSITIENDIQFTTESITNVNHPKSNIALSTNSNFTGLMVQYLPNNNISGGHQTAYYTHGSINMQDSINGWGGQISAEALHNKGWKNVTGFINGVQADAVPLQYKVTINMDSTRTIKFRGGFKGKGTSNIPELGVVQLPVEVRPTTTIAFPCMGSGARIARITIAADGWIQFNVASGSSISGFKAVLLSNVFYEI